MTLQEKRPEIVRLKANGRHIAGIPAEAWDARFWTAGIQQDAYVFDKAFDSLTQAAGHATNTQYILIDPHKQDIFEDCQELPQSSDMTFQTMLHVHNVPDYAASRKWLVARDTNTGYWFWGAYDDHDDAAKAAGEIHGMVFPIENAVKNAPKSAKGNAPDADPNTAHPFSHARKDDMIQTLLEELLSAYEPCYLDPLKDMLDDEMCKSFGWDFDEIKEEHYGN